MEGPSAMVTKSNNLEVVGGLRIRYIGPGETDRDAAAAKSDQPIPTGELVFYFEMRVIDKGRDGYIGIGLCGPQVASNRLPGWERHSYGYHGDDGNIFVGGSANKYGPTFTTGDVVGCCVNCLDMSCFFTKNGKMLPIAFRGLNRDESLVLYACVGLRSPNEDVDVNFGATPFVFDLHSYVEEVRKGVRATIDAVDLSTHTWTTTLNSLVLSYLTHHGCAGAAQAFADATATLMPEPVEAIAARSRIQTLILSGDIDGALSLLRTQYPGLLEQDRDLLGRLLCQRFVELVGQHADALSDEQLAEVVACGRELHALNTGDTSRLQEVFGLLAYEVPRLSPLAHLLDPSRRAPLAEAVAAAVRDRQGQPRRAPLELVAAQLGCCLGAMRADAIACAAGLSLDTFLGER